MSDVQETAVTSCWECELETDQAIIVKLPAVVGHQAHLRLCPGCYRSCYLTVAMDLTAGASVADH